jgi:hypothetical protein
MSYLRLRQICFVARDLERPAKQLCDVFSLAIAHRDPEIGRIGLRNVLIPSGAQPIFLEIVSPARAGTTAERYLDKRRGDGGYMFISDTSDLEGLRANAEGCGARLLWHTERRDGDPVESFQLHPKDTGGAMLEFDRHGSGEDLHGAYRFAGPNWRKAMRLQCVKAILGAELQTDDPERLAKRWARIFGREVTRAGPHGIWELRLDNAFARFSPLKDDRGEGLSAVHVSLIDPTATRSNAERLGVEFDGEDPIICGVRFVLDSQ